MQLFVNTGILALITQLDTHFFPTTSNSSFSSPLTIKSRSCDSICINDGKTTCSKHGICLAYLSRKKVRKHERGGVPGFRVVKMDFYGCSPLIHKIFIKSDTRNLNVDVFLLVKLDFFARLELLGPSL